MADADEPLVVYSDYVCPFCYLGKHSLETYLDEAEDPPEVEWRAFDLRRHKRGPDGEIDPTIEDGKDEAYLQRAKRNVERLADKFGVEMTWDLDRDTDSWDAHKLALYAREEHGDEVFEPLNEALFEAIWAEGRDPSDPAVLVDVGTAAGMSEEAIREALANPQLDERLDEVFRESHQAGITGVPTFIHGDLRLPGAVPPADIATIVEDG